MVCLCVGIPIKASAAVGPQLYSDGVASWYLDTSSLIVQQNDSEGHAFAENIVKTAVDNDDDVLGVQTIWFSQAVDRRDFTRACMSYDGENWNAFDVSAGNSLEVNAFQYGWPLAFGCGWS
jgi:hypothetical protein